MLKRFAIWNTYLSYRFDLSLILNQKEAKGEES
jgi:hypothetical protein